MASKLNASKIVKYPLSTEKAIRLMESQNSLVFVVEEGATKKEIKEAIETLYEVKVVRVNTMNGPKGRKKAYIRFSEETPAIDLATRLGLM